MGQKLILLLTFLFSLSLSQAQNISGQWTGGFVSTGDMWGGKTEYVLELDIRGEVVEGHSYTYFMIMGKRCYVICKLKGNYDPGSKSVAVTEVAKVKSNTPPDFRDCLQTHILTFFKQGEREVLKGKWKSATEKDNCGTGMTELERKALVKVTPAKPDVAATAKPAPDKETIKKPVTPSTSGKSTTKTKSPQKKANPPVVKKTTTPAKKTAPSNSKPIAKTNQPKKENATVPKSIEKPIVIEKENPTTEPAHRNIKIKGFGGNKLENRSKHVIKTIDVPEPAFRVDLYDNGQIDGDTVTLYFNGKLMMSKQRLSTAPITMNIKLDTTKNDNDLVMIAENLGSIPPNTALMVVTVGDKRYEVNITSTEQTNGTVRFRLKE